MRPGVRLLVCVGVSGLLLAVAAGAGGQVAGTSGLPRGAPSMGADFRISGAGATGEDSYPAAAWSGTSNQYLVVWQDQRNPATRGADIYGRRIDAEGNPAGADFRISGPGATGDDLRPAVAWNGAANQYLVVWQDQRDSSAHHGDIYGRRVSATGVVGSDFRISNPGATGEWPAVVWNGTANQYLVVWQDERDAATHGGAIYGRRVSAAGAMVGADFPVSSRDAVSGKAWAALAWNGIANQYLVVWMDERNEATRGWDVYGRRVSAAGAVVGADLRISGPAAVGNDWWPTVAWNGTADQYLVVWGDERDSSTRGFDIRGRRVSAAGAVVGADFRISGRNATASDESPVVAWNETADQYLVIWMDGRDDAHRSPDRGCDVYGRRVSAEGAVVGAEFRISGPGATTDDVLPAVAWGGTANRYLVAWSEARNYLNSNWDIYGRQIVG